MTGAEADAYYFPPGRSVARRVHGDRAVGLLYGQRALLIGALEPLTYTGTMLSTKASDRPFKRLARTAKIQETIFLGTRAEADEELAKVHRMHETIGGTLPEAAGAHPAGTPYSAYDPELMLWTLAVIADSGRAIYEALVRRLSDSDREDLWQDYVRFGELFGLRRNEMPASHARVQRMVRCQARLTRPRGHPARARDGAAVRLRATGPAPRPLQPRRPEPPDQGHAAASGAGDLRYPLVSGPRDELPGRRRHSPAGPAPLPAAGPARAQRLLLRHRQRTEQQRGGTGPRSCTSAPLESVAAYLQGLMKVPRRKVPSLNVKWPRACRRPVSQRALT